MMSLILLRPLTELFPPATSKLTSDSTALVSGMCKSTASNVGRSAIPEYLGRNPDCHCGNAPGEFPPESLDLEMPALMKLSDVHVYMEGNACVWASKDLIAIQAPERCLHSLWFSRPGIVRELLSGDVFEVQNQKVCRWFQKWNAQAFSYLEQ